MAWGKFKSPSNLLGAGGMLIVRDEKADGTSGGTFTSGAMRTRDLNTTPVNTIASASVAANQITLPAGAYYINAAVPAYDVDYHVAKLRNVTDSTDALIGGAAVTASTTNTTSLSVIQGLVSISATKVFEIQHQCSLSQTTIGFGQATSFAGYVEVYTQVSIFKVAAV